MSAFTGAVDDASAAELYPATPPSVVFASVEIFSAAFADVESSVSEPAIWSLPLSTAETTVSWFCAPDVVSVVNAGSQYGSPVAPEHLIVGWKPLLARASA